MFCCVVNQNKAKSVFCSPSIPPLVLLLSLLQAVVAVAKELEAENYHDIKRITARKDNVIRLWEYLLELLKARRLRLEMTLGLQRVFQEMLYIMDWMDEMKVWRGGTSCTRN